MHFIMQLTFFIFFIVYVRACVWMCWSLNQPLTSCRSSHFSFDNRMATPTPLHPSIRPPPPPHLPSSSTQPLSSLPTPSTQPQPLPDGLQLSGHSWVKWLSRTAVLRVLAPYVCTCKGLSRQRQLLRLCVQGSGCAMDSTSSHDITQVVLAVLQYFDFVYSIWWPSGQTWPPDTDCQFGLYICLTQYKKCLNSGQRSWSSS